MDVEDDVHIVLCNGVCGDGFEEGFLVAAVVVGAGDLDPGGVGGGDAEDSDVGGGEFVNVGRGDEGCVAAFENWAALGSEGGAAGPFVGRAAAVGAPEGWVDYRFLV